MKEVTRDSDGNTPLGLKMKQLAETLGSQINPAFKKQKAALSATVSLLYKETEIARRDIISEVYRMSGALPGDWIEAEPHPGADDWTKRGIYAGVEFPTYDAGSVRLIILEEKESPIVGGAPHFVQAHAYLSTLNEIRITKRAAPRPAELPAAI